MAKISKTNLDTCLRALARVILAYAPTRRFVAIHSVKFFTWYYLGTVLAPHQVGWIRELLRRRRCGVLSPIGHGKTEAISKDLMIWLIVRNRNVRILNISKSGGPAGVATKNAMVVRQEFESNPKLISDFGTFYSTDRRLCRTWTQTCFQVIRSKNLKDATFEAIGIKGALTGSRFDIIVMDDPVDYRSEASAAERKMILEDFKSTIETRLEPDGFLWFIGTRKAFNDLYSHFITNPMWTVIVQKAIIREPEEWEYVKLEELVVLDDGTIEEYRVVIHSEDRGEVLWPEQWPMEKLLLRRLSSGSITFNREFQNECTDDETSDFRLSWLQQCRDENLSYISGWVSEDIKGQFKAIIAGTDPSLVISRKEAEARNTSFMVQVAFGLTDSGERRVLSIERTRGHTPAQAQNRIQAFNEQKRTDYHFVEANAFGAIFTHNLIEERGVRILKHITGQNKSDPWSGVPSLSALFENGKVRLPYKTPEDKAMTDTVISEFYTFGQNETDDIVMAFWIAEAGVQRFMASQIRKRKREKLIHGKR